MWTQKETVVVMELRENELFATKCIVDRTQNLLRAAKGTGTWPLPGFDPKPYGRQRVYVASGVNILPWPEKIPKWDVMANGKIIEVTPEYLDQLVRDSDTEAWLRGVRGMTWADRLVHLAAGAAIGMVLTYFLLKMIGFAGNGAKSGTSVIITNTSAANATTLATAVIHTSLHFALLAHGGGFA